MFLLCAANRGTVLSCPLYGVPPDASSAILITSAKPLLYDATDAAEE